MGAMPRKKGFVWLAILAALCLFIYVMVRPKPMRDPAVYEIRALISLAGDRGHQGHYQRWIDEYNRQNPQANVVPYFVISDSHAILKLLYSGQAGQRYDVACLGAEQVASLYGMGLVEPLDRWLLRDLGVGWINERALPEMVNTMKAGRIYSLPFFSSQPFLYYNKEQVAIDPEGADLEGIFAVADQYRRRHASPGLLFPADALLLELLVADQQAAIVMAGKQASTLDLLSDEKLRMVNGFIRVIDSRAGANYQPNQVQGLEPFFSGAVPMAAAGSADQERIRQAAGFDIGAVPIKMDGAADFPIKSMNLYLIRQPDPQGYAASWEVIKALNQLSAKEREGLAGADACGRMAVAQNAKIERMLELAFLRLWDGAEAPEDVMAGVQLQVDGILGGQ